MIRRPYLAGVAILVTLLLSSALGVQWVDVDGGVKPGAVPAAPAPKAPVGIVSSAPAGTIQAPTPPPTPEFAPLPLDYVYLDPALYGINVFPWYSYYSGFRHQHLYLASEIGRGGTIDQIAIFKTYAYTYAGSFPNMSLKMCNTTVTSLTSTFSDNYGGATPVWVFHESPHVTTSSTYSWDTVALQTPFNYDGKSNLLVEITWIGSASGLYSYVWYNNLGGNRRAGAYNISDTNVSTANYVDYCYYNTRIGFRSVANDIGVSAITAPTGLWDICDTILPVICNVSNYGTAAQANIPVVCRMRDSTNGAIVYYDSVYANIAAGKTVACTFKLAPGVIAPIGHNTRLYDTMWTELPTDVRPYNDTANSTVMVNTMADVTMSYNDGTTGAPGCYTWTTPNYSQGDRFPGHCPLQKFMIGLSGYSTDPGGPYPCTCKVRKNDGTNGMPGTILWSKPLMLYSSGYPNDYHNFITLDPPVTVASDSFYVTWKPQQVANPFESCDWDPPIQKGNDFGTNPGSETWGLLNIAGAETDANCDLQINGYYSGYLHDVAIGSIDAPADTVDSSKYFTPAVTAKNAGLKYMPGSNVNFWITDTHATKVCTASFATTGLNAGQMQQFAAKDSLTLKPTWYTDSADISNPHFDAFHHNDTLAKNLFMRYNDIMVQIVSPRKNEVPGLVPVTVKLINKGNVPSLVESLQVTINPGGYSANNATGIPLAPGEIKNISLVPWVAPLGATETTVAWITDKADMFHPSDTAMTITSIGIPGWAEITPLPAPPSGKQIKDGACMAYDALTDAIWASKGNKTGDFYEFQLPAATWTNKPTIPLGLEGKSVYKGSVMCADGSGNLYLTKGNNTSSFWKYDHLKNTWTELYDVPKGASNKAVKPGAGLAWGYKDTLGYAYLLKGYKNEFERYDPRLNTWKDLLPAPIGLAGHVKYDAGSWLVADPTSHLLYAFKAKYHEMYAYDTQGDSWGAPLTPIPIPGPDGAKKTKDGCCAAWYSGKIYSLKGGGTTEFWRYFPIGDSWNTQFDIPLTGMTGQRKKVAAGGSLAGYPGTGVYAFKGNNTLEFWRYTPYDVVAGAQPNRGGVASANTTIDKVSFAIAPNPLIGGLATVRYSLPKAGLATLNVFDVTGRTVLSQTMAAGRTGTASLDLRKLDAGVYLVKVATEGFSTTQKLVVEH